MLGRMCTQIQYNAAPQLTLEINTMSHLVLSRLIHNLDSYKQDSCCGHKEGDA
jgi:hypothetical protein